MSARVHLRRHHTGACVAAIDVAHPYGEIRCTGVGSWFSDALSVATSVAQRITSDPVMSAILPPQATMAINAVQKLAGAAQQGAPVLRQVMQQYTGPATQRLARVLNTEAQRRGVAPVLPAFRGGPSPYASRDHRAEPPPQRDDERDDDQGDDDQGEE